MCTELREDTHCIRTSKSMQALRATGLKTKREAVELGLKTLVRLEQQARIRRYRGRLLWKGNLDAWRADR
jgi:Arc/MetJ family transcription regulator